MCKIDAGMLHMACSREAKQHGMGARANGRKEAAACQRNLAGESEGPPGVQDILAELRRQPSEHLALEDLRQRRVQQHPAHMHQAPCVTGLG